MENRNVKEEFVRNALEDPEIKEIFENNSIRDIKEATDLYELYAKLKEIKRDYEFMLRMSMDEDRKKIEGVLTNWYYKNN